MPDNAARDDRIAENTEHIAANTAAIEHNLATLNEGGEQRWKAIHATEVKTQSNTDDIAILNLVKLRGIQFKLNILAAFVFLALLLFSLFLQSQASVNDRLVHTLCQQVQANSRAVDLPVTPCD